MKKVRKTDTIASAIRIAYHAGPADVVFSGRAWRKGVAQQVSQEELKSMTRRAGWVTFEFRQSD
jgi:hypothetical protein